jgi:hypothetical protein
MKQIVLMQVTPSFKEEVRNLLRSLIPGDMSVVFVMGVLLLLSLGVFIWAAFFRAPRARPRYNFHTHSSGPRGKGLLHQLTAGLWPSRKHRHRRHRNRRRNPTLAEAGGLPPARGEEQPPAST